MCILSDWLRGSFGHTHHPFLSPSGILIGSAVLARFTVVTNKRTRCTNTDRIADTTLLHKNITEKCFNPSEPVNTPNQWPWAQFTKYLTIYRKIIVRSTYDSDLQRAKTSFRNIAR